MNGLTLLTCELLYGYISLWLHAISATINATPDYRSGGEYYSLPQSEFHSKFGTIALYKIITIWSSLYMFVPKIHKILF